jgi:alkyl sulfatase BDS1-like metallo-beta-lactamase superfamily hydrolase
MRGARDLLARCYEQLGYAAESAIWRNFYLSGALELRSGQAGAGPDVALAAGVLAQAPVERYFEAMAAALNGPKADGVNVKLDLVFSDTGSRHRLWIENAVLHHRRIAPSAAPTDADATLTLPQTKFVQLMLGTASPKDVLMDDAVKLGGSRVDLLRFFALIEKPPRGFPIVTP